MVTGPVYDASGGHLALDFANTLDRTAGKPWVERLRAFADLLEWSERAATLSPAERARLGRLGAERPAEAASVLQRARALRDALYALFLARVEGGAAARGDLDVLNVELARALSRLRVEPAPEGFALAFEAALDLPLWPVAKAAAELLVSPESALVKLCASETCLWLFLDRTKNHQRRWCDMKVCGNRAKVRRHRARARGRPASQ